MKSPCSPIDDLLWRGYGLSICFFTLKSVVSAYQQEPSLLEWSQAWPLYWITLVAFIMLWRGAHFWLITLAALGSLRCIISTHLPEEGLLWFPAAEWALYLGLPLFSCLVLSIKRLTSSVHSRADSSSENTTSVDVTPVQLIWRISFTCAMSFAALHKLNADFYEPAVSCVRLSERLTAWWGAPEALYDWISPSMIIGAESGLSLLLWIRPRLGILCAALIFGHFGSIGATAFATLMLVMTLSFLGAADLDRIREICLRHRWRSLGLGMGLCIGVSSVSGYLYEGKFSWPQYAFFQCLIAITLYLICMLIRADGGGMRAVIGQHSRPVLSVTLFSALLWVGNGLTPYLGIKFQYSFAMLSNLRVDDARWNSFLFSKEVRLSEHDSFAHVTRVEYRSVTTGRRLSGGPLKPALYSLPLLKAYLKSAEEVGEVIRAEVNYQGQIISEISDPPARLHDWLATQRGSVLFQGKLSASGAQRCVH